MSAMSRSRKRKSAPLRCNVLTSCCDAATSLRLSACAAVIWLAGAVVWCLRSHLSMSTLKAKTGARSPAPTRRIGRCSSRSHLCSLRQHGSDGRNCSVRTTNWAGLERPWAGRIAGERFASVSTLVVENYVQKRTVHLQCLAAVVINEPQLPKPVHEEADSRASCAHHLC